MIHRVLTLSILLIAACVNGLAQNYIYNRISISDGLLSNNVRNIWQDKTGYLWIGTENGLQRYDGNRFRTILNRRVEQIFSDQSNRVWIRSGKQVGILNIQTFKFTAVGYEGSREVYSNSRIWLQKDASGNVYLQLTGNNVQYFNEQKQRFSSSNNPFSVPTSLKVFNLAEDLARKRYWILSSEGIGYWDKTTKAYYSTSNNEQQDPFLQKIKSAPKISNFFIGHNHTYWLLESNNTLPQFLSYDSKSNQYTKESESLNNNKNTNYFDIYNIENINDSTTAIYGLNFFHLGSGNNFRSQKPMPNDPYGIQFNSVSDVFQDKEGIIWVATDNGLYYTSNSSRNIHIIFSQEQARSSVSSLLQDHENNLWAGTWGRGVYYFNHNFEDSSATAVKAISDLDNYTKLIWTLCEDNHKKLWAGCQEGRLVRYDLREKKAKRYIPPAFQNSPVRQIIKDKKGTLWIGLQNGKIFTLDPSITEITDQSIQEVCALNGTAIKMVLMNDQQIWVSIVGKGIYVINTDSRKVIQSIDPRKTGNSYITNTRDILNVNDTLCFAAGEQLLTINTRTYKVYENPDYNIASTGTIHTLQKDRKNNFWIGSANGIFKLNTSTKTLTKYTQQDGLITIHNNSYVPERSAMLRSGALVFGGNQHLIIFDPDQYNNPLPTPNVTITGFLLNDRYLPEDSLSNQKEISIPYEHRSFAIEFAALNFKQRGKLIYEFKLDGIDKEWTIQNEPTPIKYNFLPHGRYRFLVRTKNESGQYAPKITSLNLYIAPPFWKTIWFYILITVATAALLFYLHRLRLQKLLQIERVRSRLARDLHDDMGSTLSTINILSNMALQQKTIDAERNKQYMTTINSSTSQMMEAMDDIVWSINPANDSITKTIARMKETAGTVLEPNQIEYHFEVSPTVSDLRLSMEARREIFLIFKEALNNIVKYAKCTEVVISLSKKSNNLNLVIADNGIGLQMASNQSTVRGNGIKNMTKRASNLKGQLNISSEPLKGTRISLVIPIA